MKRPHHTGAKRWGSQESVGFGIESDELNAGFIIFHGEFFQQTPNHSNNNQAKW
jgi:hypothetical protein